MEMLFFALGIAILCYLGFVLLFPKAVPGESDKHTKNVLRQLYEDSQTIRDNIDTEGTTVLREEMQHTSPLIRTFYSLPFMRPMYEAMLQAGKQHIVGSFIGLLAGLFIAFLMLFSQLGLGLLTPFAAAAAAYYAPYKYFRGIVRKRNDQFINMFPDVLDMIVRSVRSGFPMITALKMVAENMDPPVSVEFRQVVDEITLGRSLTEALIRMGQRVNEPDIHFFIVVLAVQQETGGNLAEVMSNLSNIIRRRKQLRLKIRAMTSEGRATAWVLGSLPVFVFGVLYVIRREYLEPLWLDPTGQTVLGISISLVVACMWIVRQMIDIDI